MALFIWVTIVALVCVWLVRYGLRAEQHRRHRLAGPAIALAAWLWAVMRPDDGGWFLYRPLGGVWVWSIFVLLVFSLVAAFFYWRIAQLIGFIALFIAVLVPPGDLFTMELWGDLWPDDWSWVDDVVSWPVAILLLLIGLVLLIIRRFRWTGAVAVGVAIVMMALLGFGADFGLDEEPDIADPDVPVTPVDRCVTLDGTFDSVVQEEVPEGYIVDNFGDCVIDRPDTEPEPGTTFKQRPCPARFEQRYISDETLHRVIRGGIDAPTPRESLAELGRKLPHDASLLRDAARYFNVSELPTVKQMLHDKGACLSEAGRDVADDLMVVAKSQRFRFGFAPADGLNSGVGRQGNLVVDDARGITGNRKALVFTDPVTHRKRYVLVRCGNMVFPSKPTGIPVGKTDNPRPPKPPVQSSPAPTPSPSGGGGASPGDAKDPVEHPANTGDGPRDQWSPAPAPSGEATAPGGGKPSKEYEAPAAPASAGGGGDGTGSGGGTQPLPNEGSEPDDPVTGDPNGDPGCDPAICG